MSNTRTIATIGEILVEFVSHRTNCALEQICDYTGPYPSGAPAIFLDQAARMGAKTELVGGVGADGFGRSVLKRLRTDGVGVDGVNVSPDRCTGVAFVSYFDDGNRDFIFHLAGTAADQFNVSKNLLDPAKTVLHVSASSLGPASMRPKIMQVVRNVAAAGGLISCDPNARPELMRDAEALTAMQEVMDLSFCLLPSTSDLGFLYPDLSEDDAVARLLDRNTEIIAIKRGEHGATIVGRGERHDIEGLSVEEVDPTGAGDCFCGTFIALLTQGETLNSAGIMANAAGALAVTRRGPMEGNSDPAQIAQMLGMATPKKEAVACH